MTAPTIERCRKADYRQTTDFWRSCRKCNHARWISYADGGKKYICDMLNIQIKKDCVCKYYCNPCRQCRHLYDDSYYSVGLYGEGCAADDDGLETNGGEGKYPCPSFSPCMASDGLFDQLEYESYKTATEEEEEE